MSTHLDCPACRTLDGADPSHEPGRAGALASGVKHERTVLEDISRAEDRAADAITSFAGSMHFVYIHSLWFAAWIVVNLGLFGAALAFDPYPFGLLTMIVSLEAIFLATFVMITQNRQAQRADVRSELDFENNVRAEIWAVHIGHALDIDPVHVERAVRQAIDGFKRVQEA
jgi:uncharacterized membrane protein